MANGKIKKYIVDGEVIYLVTTTEAVYHNGQPLATQLGRIDEFLDDTNGNVVVGVKGENNETYRKGNVTITKADLGLGNVTNESKTSMLNDAALTGTPTAPTPDSEDSSTRVATTKFVADAIASGGGSGGVSEEWIESNGFAKKSWVEEKQYISSGNIKTINGQSIVGSGDISVQSGGNNVRYLTEAQMESLTADNAQEGILYLSLEGYNGEGEETQSWKLGDNLPIILSDGSSVRTWGLNDNLPITLT